MNPIVLFRTSYSSKPILLCWLLNTWPTSSFNELRQSVGWNMVQRSNNLPFQPTMEEIFNLTLPLEFILAKSTLDSTFFIIFTNTEKISLKLIPFFLKEFISLWISLIQFLGSPSSEAQIFLKLTTRCSLIHLLWRGSTISSGGYHPPFLRPSRSFLLLQPLLPIEPTLWYHLLGKILYNCE